MWVRYLGFVILFGLPGALHAQPCGAPGLDGGYFVPKQETYSHEIEITYACDSGRKPAVKGWWATSTCQNGVWSPEPQCIEINACIPITVPNAKYTENSDGWYEEGDKIRVTCDEGYEPKKRDATAVCLNGTWTSVPVCEKSILACGEPPQIPHAVIVGQRYQEVFAADSKVRYECEDGYSVEGAESKKNIFCLSGNWSEGPKCIRGTRPGSGGGEGQTTSSDRTQPAGGGSRPGTGQGGSAGRGNIPSAGSAVRPVGVKNCGTFPTVANGEVVESNESFLKYSCKIFYKLVGPETVLCYGDGTWSDIPICRDAYCAVNTDEHPLLVSVGKVFIKEGEEKEFDCVHQEEWWFDNYSVGKCTTEGLRLQKCCARAQIKFKTCSGVLA
ncbi:complement factor H-like isoform X1 [Labrus mixtus]|uniref:complement factor H-like isoform X1 n=1 Tax=Labrus mixtus TaxID=508554 RepID=UPI0029C0DD44|nr:complement factor H-like isoform X1 [Labrus mixtus]